MSSSVPLILEFYFTRLLFAVVRASSIHIQCNEEFLVLGRTGCPSKLI